MDFGMICLLCLVLFAMLLIGVWIGMHVQRGETMLKNEKGFSLIELAIVVAIIAALAAIAIPQFSKYRSRAYDDAAISMLRNAETCQEAYFHDNQSYSNDQSVLVNQYSLKGLDGKNILVINAGQTNYTMTAYHSSGGVTYTIAGPGGAIKANP